MDTKTINDLMGLIFTIVNSTGYWEDKRNRILDETSAEERTALGEFCAWFEGVKL